MDYINGQYKTLRYDEMTPLDRALDRYSQQAEKFFEEKNNAENAPLPVREERKKRVNEIKKQLDNERRLIENLGDIQAALDLYREQGRNMSARQLKQESHHPTADLENHMRAVPIPKPSLNHSAHHIVPGKGKTQDANRARIRMHLFGIRINDPDNGVWLPTYKRHTPHWSMPESKGHLEYHTDGYEGWVRRKLQATSGELQIRSKLQLIGRLLQINDLPDEARKKKR